MLPEKNASMLDVYMGWLEPIYIKIQKSLHETKIATLIHYAGSAPEGLKKSNEGKQTRKENRGESKGLGMLETLI